MINGNHYQVAMTIDGTTHFLLWQDGDEQPDRYVTLPGSNALLRATTYKTFSKKVRKHNYAISNHEPYVVEVDSIERVLQSLRPARPVSKRAAQFLLEMWNTFDDVSRAIDVDIVPPKGNNKKLEAIYNRLFLANNLPSMKIKKAYALLLEGEQLSLLRRTFRNAIQLLRSNLVENH